MEEEEEQAEDKKHLKVYGIYMFFDKIGNKDICKECKKEYVRTGSTTHQIEHLQKKHPLKHEEYLK